MNFKMFINELKTQGVEVIIEDVFYDLGTFVDDPMLGVSIYLSPNQTEEEMFVSLVHETVHYLQTFNQNLVGNKKIVEYNPTISYEHLNSVHKHLLKYPIGTWEIEKAAFALQYYPEIVWEYLIN
jgi:hypothetical protein